MTSPSRIQLDQILPLVYDDLRRIASRILENERSGHSYQTTELVHETYVRLAQIQQIDWADKDRLLYAAVGVMRRVLIDYARAKKTKKREPQGVLLRSPDECVDGAQQETAGLDLLALDEVLEKLKDFDERKAQVVELRYFGGQQVDTIARLLGVSPATVKRDWQLAKAWLLRELQD